MSRLAFVCAVFVLSLTCVASTSAQQKIPGNRGFEFVAKPYATGEERQAQPDLWIHEVRFKTMRMIETEVTDPKTGTKRPELFYYLVYNAVNREIESRTDNTDTVPVNPYDKDPVPNLFVPKFTLVSTDNGVRRVVEDAVVPEAQAAIERREGLKLVNSVQAVRRVTDAAPSDDDQAEGFNGVVIFRGVDPATDYFTVFLTGFSNGYKLVKGPVTYDELKQLAESKRLAVNDQIWDGTAEGDWRAAAQVGDLFSKNELPPPNAAAGQWFYTQAPDRADENVTTWRKTLVQKYWRPGDEFQQNEREIRAQGEPRWIYRPEDVVTGTAAAVETAGR
ncbi:hypothetical protein GC176_22405 [bacterium]|nr:hypothetical protein [bacterium]